MTARSRPCLRAVAAALLATLLAAPSAAAPPPASAPAPAPAPAPPARRPAVLLPTVVVEEDGTRRAPTDRALVLLAGGLDALLTDAAQDLGLSIGLTGRAAEPAAPDEADLVARARAGGTLVVAPSIAPRGGEVVIRIVLADPNARTLRVRVERVARDDVPVRAAVMLRDLVADLEGRRRGPGGPERGMPAPREGVVAHPARSVGRSTLAVHATLYGGLVGYSIQRSSGSEDPRLLYPLLAVGAGIGLGGSIIIADEWDVGLGDAWYLAAGGWWPTLAGHLVYEGRFAPYAGDNDHERWTFGLVGGATGLTLATLALVLRRGRISDGGALVAHSGGGLGLVLGGLTEWAGSGDVDATPFAGMGYGAALGWLVSAAAATQLRVSPSRVLSLDLGAALGGLAGAALGSPLVVDAPTEDAQRAWVGATAGGLLVGAGVALFLTGSSDAKRADVTEETPSWMRLGTPMIGIVGESAAAGRRAPAFGLGFRGRIP